MISTPESAVAIDGLFMNDPGFGVGVEIHS
jgi:hypothetical protein